jgi:hypothetical protein
MAEMIFGPFTAQVRRGLPRVRAVATALLLGSVCSLAPAVVHAAPDAAKVRKAAEEFDEAVRLYKQKEFAEAASHFEAADAAVPSPKALRLAIKSRVEAGQPARAATLSAYAVENYPSDQETTATAKETIEKLRSSLQEVKVSCATLCILSVGSGGGVVRSVHGNPNTRWTVFVDSGKATISASFMGDLPGGEKAVEAVGGTSVDIRFEPKSGAGPVVPPPPPSGEEPKKEPTSEPPRDEPTDGGGISPFFFLGGAVLTAAAGGVTIWSGIDATNNPGTEAVRAGCVGQGTECQLYQDGLAAEMRTNILIGVTAGLGATTLVLAILTDWDGSPEPAATVGSVKVAVPSIAASPEQGAVTFHGSF